MPTLISGSTGVNKITDGTIVDADINASAAITGSKLVMPAGSVLQTVMTTTTTEVNTTSASFVTTGLTGDISVTSGNKVLILGVINAVGPNNAHSTGTTIGVFRGATNIYEPAEYAGYNNAGSTNHQQPIPLDYLDSSPGSGTVTYTVKMYRRSGSGTARVMVDAAISRLILVEIAG
jgi:hypothetical protein